VSQLSCYTYLQSPAPPSDPSYDHALTIARLEYELTEIEKLVPLKGHLIRTYVHRREILLSQLIRERDSLVKGKKEIKQKFDAADVYVADFAKVSNLSLQPGSADGVRQPMLLQVRSKM
jgi:hypothetical protein